MQGLSQAALRMWALACMATCVIINVLSQDLPSSTPDAKQAMEYLQKFGYISNGRIRVENEMEKAISEFQQMAGLRETGLLDEDTVAKMAQPRCGVGDTPRDITFAWNGDVSRRKRSSGYTHSGGRWRKTTLAYYFLNLTPDLKGNEVKKIIARAFRDWSRVTPLRFYETPNLHSADIHIKFSRLDHGDFAPFDGPGRVLAHAYFPEDGRAHFDEDEQWSEGTAQGVNLHIVAAHEFGHLLGLGHSKEQAALMAPFYMGYRPNFRLHADDIAGIQSLYGTRLGKRPGTATRRVAQRAPLPRSSAQWMPHGRRADEGAERSEGRSTSVLDGGDYDNDKEPAPTRSPIPHDIPDPCTAQLDAITMGPDERTYAFSGAYCWVVTDTGVQQGYPVATSSQWPGLPAGLSAAAHSKRTGRTFFFAGNKFWRYRGFASDPGYPKLMSSTGLPSNVDAALIFRGRIYVFKGGEYWRWDEFQERAVPGYPRKMATTWHGVPSSPDAALTWRNGHSFFFKDGRYWRIDSHSRRTKPGYPRDTAAVWMGCSRSLKQHDVVWDDVGDDDGALGGFGLDEFSREQRESDNGF
ncbi:unnamed protein product [Lampetra fluviatilis]